MVMHVITSHCRGMWRFNLLMPTASTRWGHQGPFLILFSLAWNKWRAIANCNATKSGPEEGEWNGAEVKHNRDTSGEGEGTGTGTGGRTKWEPAAPTAHHVFKSLYDLKKKAKTNNRPFSIIYSSDVGSVLFDELPEFCARRASFVC